MEKQHAKDFLKKYITVIGGPAAVDDLDDENKAAKAKEFVKKYFTVVGGAEAIDAAAEPEVKYLTMTIPEGSPTTQISIKKQGTPVGTNFQYKFKDDAEWTDWNFETSQPIPANANDVIQWKGDNPNGISNDESNYIYFEIPNEVHLSGNVMSLIDGIGNTKVIPCDFCFCFLFQNTKIKTVTKDFLPAKTLAPYCYGAMFQGCTSLTAAPALPATTLTEMCYAIMFYGCTSLATAPALPATTLAMGCYTSMFDGCTSLTTAPALPATTLADSCYGAMFNGCTSLATAPALPATTLAPYCYTSMFYGCSSLVTAPELPATTLADDCYESMFDGCTSLTTAPELSATTLAGSCYNSMFSGCTSLATASALPATTLADSCYRSMFSGCSNLQHVTCLATDISATNCTTNWLSGVASTGTFNKAADVEWTTGTSGIPDGWTVIEPPKYLTMTLPEGSPTTQISIKKQGSPVGTNIQYRLNDGEWTNWDFTNSQAISAKANDVIQWKGDNPNGLSQDSDNYIYFEIPNEVHLSGNVMSLIDGVGDIKVIPCSYCFFYLFYNAQIKYVSKDFLPATTLKDNCYDSMFEGCTSLTTAPALPATTLAGSCYGSMFQGCTSLTTAPALTATTLADGCYLGMFVGCSKLQNVTCLATNISATDCTTRWLEGVASTGTFVKASGFNGWTTGSSGIPSGWTAIEPPKYLTMTLPEGSTATQISINKKGTPVGTNFQYKVNDEEWTNWDFTNPQAISAKANDVIQWKGVNTNGLSKDYENYIYFVIPNEVNLSGNVMSLIDGVGDADVVPCDICFYNLFKNTKIKTVTKDFLPATKLANSCYQSMFQGCTSLTTAPALPATTLAEWCYNSMFSGCTLLENAPELPATTLVGYCYIHMFEGCSALVSAPALPATTLTSNCYNSMFARCTSLVTAPELSATTLAPYCYNSMFAGCTSLATAPELSATTLAPYCYNSMFDGCTSLATAPELSATTLADYCYQYMFQRCSNLKKVTCLATDITAQNCTGYWLEGVASTGTFVKAAGFNKWTTGSFGIPSGWTIIEQGQSSDTGPQGA